MERVLRDGRPAHRLREDFSGTAALAARWVQRGPERTAVAVDSRSRRARLGPHVPAPHARGGGGAAPAPHRGRARGAPGAVRRDRRVQLQLWRVPDARRAPGVPPRRAPGRSRPAERWCSTRSAGGTRRRSSSSAGGSAAA